jgi:hypothetical protein
MSRFGSTQAEAVLYRKLHAGKERKFETQYLCDHSGCRAFIYSHGEGSYDGKYFCKKCFHEHNSEIPSTLMGSMSSV